MNMLGLEAWPPGGPGLGLYPRDSRGNWDPVSILDAAGKGEALGPAYHDV